MTAEIGGGGKAGRRAAKSGTLARVLENVGWLLAGKGAGALFSLGSIAILTRSLGLEGFGQFVLILGTAQFVAALVSFQTWQVVVRFGVSKLSDETSGALSRLIAFCLALDIGGAVAGCLIAAAGVALLAPSFGWNAALATEALLFSFVVLLSARSTAVGLLRLHDRFGQGAAADSVTHAGRLAGALVVLAAGPSVTRFLIAWAVAEVAAALVYWRLASRTPGWSLKQAGLMGIRTAPAEHEGIWNFVAITNAGATLGSVGKQLTVLLVGLAVGPAAAGAYRLAHQLGQALARVSEMLSRAIFAELARVHATGTQAQLGALFRGTFRLALAGGVLVAALLLVAGEPILRLVGGEAFEGAYPLLIVLGIAASLDMIGVNFEPALMATGRAGKAFRLRLVVTALLLVLLAVLIPSWGAWGAAIATLATAFAGLVMFGTVTWRTLHPR